jgi:hypothetical protein
MRFLPKGLNPFKIQVRFKLEVLMNFIIQNLERFGSSPKKKVCSISSYLRPCEVWKFLDFI